MSRYVILRHWLSVWFASRSVACLPGSAAAYAPGCADVQAQAVRSKTRRAHHPCPDLRQTCEVGSTPKSEWGAQKNKQSSQGEQLAGALDSYVFVRLKPCNMFSCTGQTNRARPAVEVSFDGGPLFHNSLVQFTATCRVQNPNIPPAGRVGARGGAAGRDRAGLDADRTVVQETSVPLTLQGIVNTSPEHLSRSTNKRNPM